MSRFGAKLLIGHVSGGRRSREALLEVIGEGLLNVPPMLVFEISRLTFDPWRVNRQVMTDTLGVTGPSGAEHQLPALKIGAVSRSTEVQPGTSRSFQSVTAVSLDALVGYDAPIDEHNIVLNFTAHPGWMSVGSELLAYHTTVAVGAAIAGYMAMPRQPMFTFVSGGWENLKLASLGQMI